MEAAWTMTGGAAALCGAFTVPILPSLYEGWGQVLARYAAVEQEPRGRRGIPARWGASATVAPHQRLPADVLYPPR